MNAKHITFLIAMILAVVVSVSGVYADQGRDGHGKKKTHAVRGLDKTFFHKAHFILKNGKELGLSDEQEAAIHDLKREAKKTLIRKKADAKIVQVDIMAELYVDKPDTKKVNELIDKKYEIKKSLAGALADSYVKLKSTLTAKQLDKLKEVKRAGAKKRWSGSGTK